MARLYVTIFAVDYAFDATGAPRWRDVDVLVTFSREAEISLFDLVQMQLDLEKIFHRPVDIIEKEALENPFRKREILRTAQVIYATQ